MNNTRVFAAIAGLGVVLAGTVALAQPPNPNASDNYGNTAGETGALASIAEDGAEQNKEVRRQGEQLMQLSALVAQLKGMLKEGKGPSWGSSQREAYHPPARVALTYR